MRLLIGIIASFVVGAGCRYFDIRVPNPRVIPGGLLVLAMTIGYSWTNSLFNWIGKYVAAHLCGGPTSLSSSRAKARIPFLPARSDR